MDALEIIKGNTTLVVSFGGYGKRPDGSKEFEFRNILHTFADIDTIFLKDTSNTSFHGGVRGISTNIDTTRDYLYTKIQGYTRVLFLGASGGGYGAILFGSLLNVESVLAFYPPTNLIKSDKDPRYKNLKNHINNVTKYYIHGKTCIKNPRDPHHFKNCLNIEVSSNVIVTKHEKIDLKDLRDSGQLREIIQQALD